MHTLEIAGDSIAIASGTKDEAVALFNQEQFRLDLLVLGITRETPRGEEEAKFVIRQSLPAEDLIFKQDFARALAARETTAGNEKSYLAFLVQIGEMLG